MIEALVFENTLGLELDEDFFSKTNKWSGTVTIETTDAINGLGFPNF